MRNKAPVLVFTTLFALASGSALALGDRNKEKKADTATTSSQSATSPSATGNKSQAAQNDMRCDESKYASRSAMPKECLDKSGTGASATAGTQGQSGGSSPSGAGASGPGSSSSGASGSSSGGSSK